MALILCGLAVFLYPNVSELMLERHTQKVIAGFEERCGVQDEETDGGDGTGSGMADETDATAENSLSELRSELEAYNERLRDEGQSLTDAWSYEQMPVDLEALSEDEVIGYVSIPAMDVTLPLYIGASTANMAKGAAVMAETSMPIGGNGTNCVITGHRGYRGAPYFREIERLGEGDLVYVTNPWGTLTYRVTGIAVIEPDDVSSILIQEGRDMVTLLTCHPYMSGGKYRYVVYCERADETAEDSGSAADDGNAAIPDGAVTGEERDTEVSSSEGLIRLEKITRNIAVPVIILAVILALVRKRKRGGRNTF
ncbi:MAG: class C sortase [Clostridiales bacterium]|nr:class C sortase [Clostridiales bacterium]